MLILNIYFLLARFIINVTHACHLSMTRSKNVSNNRALNDSTSKRGNREGPLCTVGSSKHILSIIIQCSEKRKVEQKLVEREKELWQLGMKNGRKWRIHIK